MTLAPTGNAAALRKMYEPREPLATAAVHGSSERSKPREVVAWDDALRRVSYRVSSAGASNRVSFPGLAIA